MRPPINEYGIVRTLPKQGLPLLELAEADMVFVPETGVVLKDRYGDASPLTPVELEEALKHAS